MVTVKNRDEFAVCHGHRVIDVAGLGVVVFFAFDVARAHFAHEVGKRRARAVVQQINVEFSLGQSRLSAAKTVGLMTSKDSL